MSRNSSGSPFFARRPERDSIEDRLLSALLRARHLYKSTSEASGEQSADVTSNSQAEIAPESVNRPAEDAALASYKIALKRFHDFVLAESPLSDVKIADLPAPLAPEDLEWLHEPPESVVADATATQADVEEIGRQMLLAFFGSETIHDQGVGRADRRAGVRVDCYGSPALLSTAGLYRSRAGILNVSKNGLGVSSRVRIAIDALVLIELTDDFRVFGKVRYCGVTDVLDEYSIGVQIFRVAWER